MDKKHFNTADDDLRLSGLLCPKLSRASSADVMGPDPDAKPAKAAVPQAAAARSDTSTAAHCETVSKQAPLTVGLIPMINEDAESEPIITENDLANLSRLARASANRRRPRRNGIGGAVAALSVLGLLGGGVLLEIYVFGSSSHHGSKIRTGPIAPLAATSATQPQRSSSQANAPRVVQAQPAAADTEPVVTATNTGHNPPSPKLRILHHAPGDLFRIVPGQ